MGRGIGLAAALWLCGPASAGSSFGRFGPEAAAWPAAGGGELQLISLASPPSAEPAREPSSSRLLTAAADASFVATPDRVGVANDPAAIDSGATLVPLPPALWAGLAVLGLLVLMRLRGTQPAVRARH